MEIFHVEKDYINVKKKNMTRPLLNKKNLKFSGKYCFIDFEFNEVLETQVNLVSCCFIKTSAIANYTEYWLHNEEYEQKRLVKELTDLKDKGFTFVAYSVEAEARSFMALGLDPLEFSWIDLWLEYRCLLNHDHRLSYGRQMTKEGRIIKTFPPKPKWSKVQGENNSKPADGITSAVFKMLDNTVIDHERKRNTRDLIISAPDEFTIQQKAAIMKYCQDDVRYLPALFFHIGKEYARRYPSHILPNLKEWMLNRGEYSARTALMVSLGYPIDYDRLKNFSDSVPKILREIQRDINSQFDWDVFRWKRTEHKYAWNQVGTKKWIVENHTKDQLDGWLKTDKGSYSLSLEAFKRFYDFRHDYPKHNLGAQLVRFLHTRQNLNGFLPAKEGKKTFWSSVGSDKRVRPYFNIYGSQSARSQPSATGFIFLKSAWMRSLCAPEAGRAISGIDYKSEEFLVGGLLSNDSAMLEAYKSGDVYLWFGKATGRIPKSATKASHSDLRDRFKSSVLGIQYGMMAPSLANKIANDTGQPCSEEEAQEFIDMFEDVFHKYMDYREDILDDYETNGFLILDDGWTMWGDNRNFRSVANFPIQGAGSSIMRKAVRHAQRRGLKVIFTLHDALYIEHDSDDLGPIDVLATAMDLGFRESFPEDIRHLANVGLDANVWSTDYDDIDDYVQTPGGLTVKKQQKYVDPRGINEYKKFSKYFDRDIDLDVL